LGIRHRLAGENGIQRVPQVVDGDLLAGLAERRVEIVDPAAVSDFCLAVDEHGFRRDRSLGLLRGCAPGIDNRGNAPEAVILEMLAHRARFYLDVFAQQRASDSFGPVALANLLNFGRVRIGNRAIGRDKEEQADLPGRLEQAQKLPIDIAHLKRGAACGDCGGNPTNETGGVHNGDSGMFNISQRSFDPADGNT
jgi:hypothetical protein